MQRKCCEIPTCVFKSLSLQANRLTTCCESLYRASDLIIFEGMEQLNLLAVKKIWIHHLHLQHRIDSVSTALGVIFVSSIFNGNNLIFDLWCFIWALLVLFFTSKNGLLYIQLDISSATCNNNFLTCSVVYFCTAILYMTWFKMHKKVPC